MGRLGVSLLEALVGCRIPELPDLRRLADDPGGLRGFVKKAAASTSVVVGRREPRRLIGRLEQWIFTRGNVRG
jgi:hypothetical protein